MISVTGGFNQQFVAGAPKIKKLKYATDSLALSDALATYAFRENISDLGDTLVLSDIVSALSDYVADIAHDYADAMEVDDSRGSPFISRDLGDGSMTIDNFPS